MERFQRPNRCQDHGHPQLPPEQCGGDVDLRDIDANPGPQRKGIQGQSIAPQRRLGFRGADKVAPDVIRKLVLGSGDELMQALEIACRLEKMFGFCLVHGFPH